jgi:hypothetical protein
LGLLLAFFLVAATLSWRYLFRCERVYIPEVGRVTYCYRWGRPLKILADTNEDGRTDFYSFLEAPGGPYSSHTATPLEFWEDRDFDQHFERHVVLQNGVVQIVEFDEDHDGVYERRIEGNQARELYGGSPGPLRREPEHP